MMVSRQGGELAALAVAVHALLMVAQNSPQVQEAVDQGLEHMLALIHGSSMNVEHVAGFKSSSDLIRKALIAPAA